jgi:methylenetetrahydrofolate reductase (NADPH)
MILRGDPPKGDKNFVIREDGFKYASEMVEFVRKKYPEIGIGVAAFPEGHPETPNRIKEMNYLKEKVDAGADYVCTQLFFDNRDFFDFKERCKLSGINKPIIAGIMTISSIKNMHRISELAQGARFPASLLKSLLRVPDDECARRVGLHWATEQVRDLIDHDVKGIHFYTLNNSSAIKDIYASLGIRSTEDLGT